MVAGRAGTLFTERAGPDALAKYRLPAASSVARTIAAMRGSVFTGFLLVRIFLSSNQNRLSCSLSRACGRYPLPLLDGDFRFGCGSFHLLEIASASSRRVPGDGWLPDA